MTMESKKVSIHKTSYAGFDFFLPNRYQPLELLGFGSFGAVIEANDTLKNRQIAIKKISNTSEDVELKKILREIIILKNLKHENIIELLDVVLINNENAPRNRKLDIYLVFEKIDTDLNKIIRSNQELSEDHYKFIFYQILRAILYLHSANVIHRDLKPSNILIGEDCGIKIW
jgi:mitogen-activated protein kinase 1/3